MTRVPIVATITFVLIVLCCVPKMTPGDACCQIPGENTTDMDGAVRWTSLTLERKDTIKWAIRLLLVAADMNLDSRP